MSTKIYGTSDDLVEFEGDVSGEVSCYRTREEGKGILLICSDGTLLEAKYGKADMAIWEMKLLFAGAIFDKIDTCMDEDADPYSDVAHFRDDLKWVYAARQWERVK